MSTIDIESVRESFLEQKMAIDKSLLDQKEEHLKNLEEKRNEFKKQIKVLSTEINKTKADCGRARARLYKNGTEC